MLYSVVPLLVAVEDKFIRAPGFERQQETVIPGEKSAGVIVDGTMALLNTGAVTLLVLPVLAVILYARGYRIAGPMPGLFTLGLFLARMFGAPA